MKEASTKINSANKLLKVSDETKLAYENRDKNLENLDPDNPVMPPKSWEGAVVGKYYRPLKTPASER